MAAEETVASLCGRNPADLKVAELKLWLQEWKKSTRGKGLTLLPGIRVLLLQIIEV